MLVSWNITRACNLKCEHCYRDAGDADADELTLAEGKKLLSDLHALHFRLIIFPGENRCSARICST
jgi:Predicted Fe-S oxidoreductases